MTAVGNDATGEAAAADHGLCVVGIGASAGGLEALQGLFAGLRLDDTAYVVVQHLSPKHVSLLPELLGRSTSLAVVTVQEGMRVEPNRVYVIPANAQMAIRHGVLHLSPGSGSTAPRQPIDHFFESLAVDCGRRAIGVVLSGGGTDGTAGLKAIKAEGGITFAQDPTTAAHASMPQSAVDSGFADFSLPVDKIAAELSRIRSHAYVALPAERPAALDTEALTRIFEGLARDYGVDFGAYKRSTIERRIERRMALQRIEALGDYVKFLEQSPRELALLYGDLLIGVTSFFRDRGLFDAIKGTILPRLLDRRPRDAPVRIWVAGTSTGEEAYSVAMCVAEFQEETRSSHKVQVFATDIDDDAVRRARAGVYPKTIEGDVDVERLARFFTREDDGEYRIGRQLRDMVVFATHNLGKDAPFSRLDLVTCRNVLIYMQPPLQRRVMRIFHYALVPDGFLVLGTSETVGEAADLFTLADRKLRVYAKKNVPASAAFELATAFAPAAPHIDGRARGTEIRTPISSTQLADRKVLERYGPPGVVVNDRLEVVQFRGRLGPFLGPTPGAATLALLKLVRPELLVVLKSTLEQCATESLPVTSGPVHMKDDRGLRRVVIDAMPLHEPGSRRTTLVLFSEGNASLDPEPGPKKGKKKKKKKGPPPDPRIQELEHELASTKEYLQSTNEELEAANEELRSSNEELQSANEELQSINEELETSKEELQSANEELATVNEELQNRMAELSVANDDLQNVLAWQTSAMLLVGPDLRIRRFSRVAERLLDMIGTDAGRPVGHLKAVLGVPDVEDLVAEVIASVAPARRDIGVGGQQFTVVVSPYRTADHAIRGAVIELVEH